MRIIETENIPIKLWTDDIDAVALTQAKDIANLPYAFKWIAIMPDVHPGFGMPIGGVLATTKIIVPNAVGVDIGCGMETVKTNIKEIDTDTLKKIMKDFRAAIPVGYKHHTSPQEWNGFNDAPNVDILQRELKSAQYQIGTLGGGNHFLEILKDKDGFIWLMVHSGSRNFGFKTANFYNNLAIKLSSQAENKVPNRDLCYLSLDSSKGQDYQSAMNYCMNFAQANRDLMIKRMKEVFFDYTKAEYELPINSIHNFASIETHYGQEVVVHRKGATLAAEGCLGVIPGSMGTPSYIVQGLGNPESFNSSAHGAGRKLGRNQAIRSLDLLAEQAKMPNVLGSPRNKSDLQEAPGAYKDIHKVMKEQSDLVMPKLSLDPIAVIIGN